MIDENLDILELRKELNRKNIELIKQNNELIKKTKKLENENRVAYRNLKKSVLVSIVLFFIALCTSNNATYHNEISNELKTIVSQLKRDLNSKEHEIKQCHNVIQFYQNAIKN